MPAYSTGLHPKVLQTSKSWYCILALGESRKVEASSLVTSTAESLASSVVSWQALNFVVSQAPYHRIFRVVFLGSAGKPEFKLGPAMFVKHHMCLTRIGLHSCDYTE